MVKPELGDRLISFDPGIRNAGIAEFEFRPPSSWEPDAAPSWRLSRAALIRNPVKKGHDLEAVYGIARAAVEWVGTGIFIGFIACEVPKLYPAARKKGDENISVVPLAMVSAAFSMQAGLSRTVLIQYYPSEWKGSGDADICTDRVEEELARAGELHLLEPCPESLRHNMLDGCGVGLKFAGRFEPRRVYPL